MAHNSADAVARRGALDAARGSLTRVGVVLYVCVPEGTDSAPALAAARTYALARDFRILAEFVDTGFEQDLTARSAWAELRCSLAEGIAQGLVISCVGTSARPRWSEAVATLDRPGLFVQHAERNATPSGEER